MSAADSAESTAAAFLRIDPSVEREIRASAAAAYPNEGCGALLGEGSQVDRTIPVPNSEPDKPRTRFQVAPRDYLRVEEEASRLGLSLVGFWHSHPDHPARPSETDRAYAWEGLVTVVIAVEKGTPRDITAWTVNGPDDPFAPLGIRIE